MKKIGLLAVFLLLPIPSFAAYTVVSAVSAVSTNTSSVQTGNINTVGANLIVVAVGDYGNVTTCPVTDNQTPTNTYTALNSYNFGGGSDSRIHLEYIYAPTVGATHNFSCNCPSGACYPSISVVAFAGAVTSPFDGSQNGAATNCGCTTVAPGSITPTLGNELVVTGVGHDAPDTMSINGGFTIGAHAAYSSGVAVASGLAYLVQGGTAAAAAPTWTLSANMAGTAAADIVSFKAAAGATGPKTGTLTTLGVGK